MGAVNKPPLLPVKWAFVTRDGCCFLMAKLDVVEQLKAPAETGEREMNSKRRAAAEEEDATLGKAVMIDRRLEAVSKNKR